MSGQQLEFFNQETQEVLIQPTAESMMEAINAAFEAGGQQLES